MKKKIVQQYSRHLIVNVCIRLSCELFTERALEKCVRVCYMDECLQRSFSDHESCV